MKIAEGMRVRQVVRALELHGVSHYKEGDSLPFLKEEEILKRGEDYFLSPKNRSYMNNQLECWSMVLRGVRRRIEDESIG